MCKFDRMFPYRQSNTLFKGLLKFFFLIRFISKMNDNISRRKISFIQFYLVNVKEIRAQLAEKISRSGAKITTIFKLSWKYFNCIIIKTF